MSRAILALVFLVIAPAVSGASLRSAPVKPNKNAPISKAAAKSAGVDAKGQVTQLRAKLSKVSGGFTKLLSGPTGKTHVGFLMSKVNDELVLALKATENEKDTKKALDRLQNANAAVKQLSKDMASEQEKLMREGNEQEESLLLGVLMQRQKEPMAKQLEVMKNPEFAKLPVVVAVLAAKDNKTPLFKQVAAYLDAHAKPKEAEPQIPDKLKTGKDGKPDVTPIVLALEARLHKMEESERKMEEHHEEEVKELDRVANEKKNNTRAVLQIQRIKKKDSRTFAKRSAMAKHDIKALKTAVESVKKGDMAGLAKAQEALAASMKSAQAPIYFIQIMQRAEGQDCPYCVAQCVDKCHNDGKPYTTCLGDCADAGK